nr:ATP-binding protein [Fundidesulfovibrio terrae]
MRLFFAVLIPFAAFAVQWTFWAAIKPYVWFLFFPAVFFSSWVGGLRGGLAATAVSALLVLYFFIPSEHSFVPSDPVSYISIAIFLGLGVLFSISHERLRLANKRASDALEATRRGNTRLQEANDKITQLYQRTRELDELKTQLYANISHELRTPLTLILGPLEKMLEAPDLPARLTRDLDVMQRNARLLYRHVTDLLDVAKLEAGRMSMRYAELDLASLTRLTASLFESHTMNTRVSFTLELPRTLTAQVDSEKVQRILVNLLSNAFKFIPPDGKVELSLAREDGHAVFRVRDNGPGVPEAMRASVFERFRQLDGGPGRKRGGTGLGLAIVKEFAELHGGSADVAPAEGGGALFTVRLPLAAPAGAVVDARPVYLDSKLAQEAPGSAEAADAAPRDGLGSLEPGAGRDGLVLVVEDNPDMNGFITRTLASSWRVISAFDGRDGLEKALRYRPDLIVSDVMMPVLTGEGMVRELRRRPEMVDVPIIMLTAKADEALRLSLLKEGVQDYITKPFSSEVLLARVDGCMKERRRHAAELTETRKRFQATFELAAVGMAQVSVEGRWILVNQKLCDIVGYSREEMFGMTFQDITHPDDLASDLDMVGKVISGEIKTYSREKRYIRKDKSSVWTNLTVALVRDASGAPGYFISVIEDIQARKDAQEAVNDSLREKDVLLKEIHHRVKNNLQIITSLISLQCAGISNPGELERAERLEWRIRSMALIHEQLYGAADNFASIDMAEYIENLAGKLAASFSGRNGKVRLHINAAPTLLGIDKAVPCGLLVNELITNAFKHAFDASRGGNLNISLHKNGSEAQLTISDDGPGFPEGFDIRDSPSLGAQLVSELARQLGGTLRTDNAPGAEIEVRFPLGKARRESML